MELRSSTYKRKTDLLLECNLCHSQLVNNQPKSLPCLHTFCTPCLTNNIFIQDTNISCPVCHTMVSQPSEYSEIINNLELDVIIEKLLRVRHLQQSGHYCGMCGPEKDVMSTKWCRDCEKFLCDSCLVPHGNYKPKDKVIDLSQEGNGSVKVSDFILPTRCTRHEKKIKMYCSQCEICLCSSCSIEHRSDKNENCAPVSIGIDTCGTKTQEGLNLLEEMSSCLEKEQQRIEDMKLEISELENQFLKNRADIWEKVEETVRRLKENACSFVAEMEAATKSEIEQLETSIQLRQDCIKEMEITDVTFHQLLQSFDNIDILHNYPRLECKSKNLLMQLNNSASNVVNMEYNDWYLGFHEKSENVPLARCWKDLKLSEASSYYYSSYSSSYYYSSSSNEKLNIKPALDLSKTKTGGWLTYLRKLTGASASFSSSSNRNSIKPALDVSKFNTKTGGWLTFLRKLTGALYSLSSNKNSNIKPASSKSKTETTGGWFTYFGSYTRPILHRSRTYGNMAWTYLKFDRTN